MRELQCGGVVVWRSLSVCDYVCSGCSVKELQFLGVVAYGNCGVGELWYVGVMMITKP